MTSLSANESMLYVGGNFTTLGEGGSLVDRPYFGAINLSNGQIDNLSLNVDTNFQPITAVTATNSSIYLGGNFSGVNGVPRHRVAAISTTTGEVTDWKLQSIQYIYAGNSWINTIAAYHDGVFIGGGFDRITTFWHIMSCMMGSGKVACAFVKLCF